MGSVKLGWAVLAIAAVLALAACGDDDNSGGGNGTGAEASASDRPAGVPATVRIGAAVGFPPFEYYDTDGSTVIGFEPDIFNEVFERLGAEPQWVNAKFETLFTGVESGRFDVLINGIFDKPDRHAKFDFVDYLRDESGILVVKGNPKNITSTQTLCGTAIVALRGTAHETYLRDQSKACTAGGEEAVDVVALADHSSGLVQMKAGRVDGVAAQFEQINYWIRESPDEYDAAPYSYHEETLGAVFDKGNDDFVKAVHAELQEMIDDGTYEEILGKWDLGELAIDKATVNLGK